MYVPLLCSYDEYWRHSIAFSFNADSGGVYTWGWKECVPSGKVIGEPSIGANYEKDVFERQSSFLTEKGSFILVCLS